MIKFQRITTADTALYGYMEQLMTTSFPSEEYRSLDDYVIIQIASRIFTVTLFSIMILQSVLLHIGISDNSIM